MDGLRPPILTEIPQGYIVSPGYGVQQHCTQFKHKPLTGHRTIRLIELDSERQSSSHAPGANFNIFRLVERSLDQPGLKYATLSYCWGDQVKSAPFLIREGGDIKVFQVTASAWEAVNLITPCLVSSRRAAIPLWIDQICIDQKNKPEKDQQVAMMGDIYRRGWCCGIWLGAADSETGFAFSLVRRIEAAFPQRMPMELNGRHASSMSHRLVRESLVTTYGRDYLPSESDPGWPAVARLLKRSWFSRLWTFQEAVLSYAGDAVVCCGRFNVPIITMLRAAILLGRNPAFGVDLGDSQAVIEQISEFRCNVERGNPTPLVWLLQVNDYYNCFDPLDRVYALLGMRNEDRRIEDIHVDYNTPVSRLYTDVAKKIIISQHSLRLCAAAPERKIGGDPIKLPSWVPNWTAKSLTIPFEFLDPQGYYFRASLGYSHIHSPSDPDVLKARGRVLDKVLEIIDVQVPDSISEMEMCRYLVQELLPHLGWVLFENPGNLNEAQQMHRIIKTITLDGYTRKCNMGNFGLPDDAWSENTCHSRLTTMLAHYQYPPAIPYAQPVQDWLSALAKQAIACCRRRFALLRDKSLALVPEATKVGDSIAILHGSSLPFALAKDGSTFKLVGVCFVDGWMHGERTSWSADDGHVIEIN